MSVDNNVLSALPSSVNATNAESGANAALASWKTLSAAWSQETADAAGTSSVNYAMQWKSVVLTAIEEKIEKYKSEYEEKKSHYDAAKEQYNSAEKSVRQAQKDMDACMDYPSSSGSGLFQNNGSSIDQKKVIVNHYGYNLAKNREAQAKAEQNRYDAEMKNWKKQMDSAESKISDAEKEKSRESTKIENFIMNVYNLHLMNESSVFLRAVQSSNVEISKSNQKKLYSRLFLIENKYRKQFEQFEQIISSAGEKYLKKSFQGTERELNYFANREIKGKKFKSEIAITLKSTTSDSAKLNFISKKELTVSKDKIQTAQEKVQSECKNYVLYVDRSNFKIELNKIYENEAIVDEISKIDVDSDSYVTECQKILDILQENGASSNKLKILFGKIGNYFAHSKEKREAYKKMTPEERAAAKAEEKRRKKEQKEAKKR